jgi:hypothetical protein
MVEDMRLKLLHLGPTGWHHLPTKFQENPPIGSEVIAGDRQTHIQTGRLVI